MLSWRKWVRKTAGHWATNVKANRRRLPKSMRHVEPLEVRTLLSADLGYVRRLGNNAAETAVAMTADAAGNQYFVGTFSSTVDFDPGVGTVNLTSAGATDNFVTKFDPSGNLVWARRFGALAQDSIAAVAVDSAGNVYTTGTFTGAVDFDPGASETILIGGAVGSSTAYVSKLDSDGNFVWAKAFGSNVFSSAITVDVFGNVYTVGGYAGSTDFDPGEGSFILNIHGILNSDVFVSKLDNDGNFVWARGMGGTNTDIATAVAVDISGNVVVGGSFSGTADFNPGAGTFNLVCTAFITDGFVTKLDSDGDFVWAKRLGGAGDDKVRGVALDSTGNVLLTGTFVLTADFDPGASVFNLTSQGASDAFVAKLRSDGSFVWAKAAAGNLTQVSVGIAVDAIGNVYTSGTFEGTTDFDPSASDFNLVSAGATDSYLTKLNSSGEFVWGRRLGGAGQDTAVGIALDAAGNVLTAGHFTGTSDFDPGPAIFPLVSSGNASDAFVAKYVQTPFFTIPSDGEPHDLTLRLNGTFVELFDNIVGSVVASGVLTNLIDLAIVGGFVEQDDLLTVDYNFGGFFRLPGGIHFGAKSESRGDRLTIIGNPATQTFGSYLPSGTTYGAGSFSVTSVVPPNSTSTTRVDFHGVETPEVANMVLMTFVTPNSSDFLTVSAAVGSNDSPANVVSGTSDGQFLSTLTFFDVTTFRVQTDVNDRALPDDFVTIGSTLELFETEGPTDEANERLNAAGLRSFSVLTGKGNDVLDVTLSSFSLPEIGGTFSFDAGIGTDRIQTLADVDYTLTNATLTIPGDASLSLTSVETASLGGGHGDNVLNASAFSGKTTLFGNGGDDLLLGSSKNDFLNGGDGDDTVNGGAGNDSLDGGDGDNSLVGGTGIDTLMGNGGNDTLRGGDGNDTLFDLEGNNLFDGGAGNDNLAGGDSNDTLLGGSGNDTLIGDAGDDSIDGGTGNDQINGGTGNDILQGGTGRDDVFGDDGNDMALGGSDRDFLDGGAGNDTVDGGDGNDSIFGGNDDDSLVGGLGNDTIRAGTGSDTIDGGAGTDSYELDMLLTDLLINGELTI